MPIVHEVLYYTQEEVDDLVVAAKFDGHVAAHREFQRTHQCPDHRPEIKEAHRKGVEEGRDEATTLIHGVLKQRLDDVLSLWMDNCVREPLEQILKDLEPRRRGQGDR